jgi:transposase
MAACCRSCARQCIAGRGTRDATSLEADTDRAHARGARDIATRLAVSTQTVGKWRARFIGRRLAGLLDDPRSGAPRSISDALVEAVLAKTLHEQPPDAGRWSSRRLAHELGISQRAVLRIWRTFEV